MENTAGTWSGCRWNW